MGIPLVVHNSEERIECILERARAGEREAFDRLISLYEKKVMKTALYLTHSLADAEDVAQEVYIKIFQSLPLGKANEIDAWVFRGTVNTSKSLLRKRRLWTSVQIIVSAFKPSDQVVESETRSRLADALTHLSFNERAAFVLRELHDLRTQEVAGILGCRAVTVRGYVHTARKKLQELFADYRKQP